MPIAASYSLGLYGGTECGALAFRSSLTASVHDLAISRDVVIPGFADHLSTDYKARSLQAFAELGYRATGGLASITSASLWRGVLVSQNPPSGEPDKDAGA